MASTPNETPDAAEATEYRNFVELEVENGQLRETLETLEQRLATLEGAH